MRLAPVVVAVLISAWLGGALTAQGSRGLSPDIERAKRHIEEGDAGAAERILRPLVSRGTRNPLTHYLLGVALSQMGRYPDSNGSLKAALQLDPNLSLAYRFLGSNALESGEPDVAKRHIERYLRTAPEDPVVHLTPFRSRERSDQR